MHRKEIKSTLRCGGKIEIDDFYRLLLISIDYNRFLSILLIDNNR